MIRNQKLQYDINREVAKILALASGKIDKYNLKELIKLINIIF